MHMHICSSGTRVHGGLFARPHSVRLWYKTLCKLLLTIVLDGIAQVFYVQFIQRIHTCPAKSTSIGVVFSDLYSGLNCLDLTGFCAVYLVLVSDKRSWSWSCLSNILKSWSWPCPLGLDHGPAWSCHI